MSHKALDVISQTHTHFGSPGTTVRHSSTFSAISTSKRRTESQRGKLDHNVARSTAITFGE